jgi:hypothetical protein
VAEEELKRRDFLFFEQTIKSSSTCMHARGYSCCIADLVGCCFADLASCCFMDVEKGQCTPTSCESGNGKEYTS